ncbi:MAG: hypothetical protein Q7R62_01320 [bacterium]|nr:hypothetical protein [bacterium]
MLANIFLLLLAFVSVLCASGDLHRKRYGVGVIYLAFAAGIATVSAWCFAASGHGTPRKTNISSFWDMGHELPRGKAIYEVGGQMPSGDGATLINLIEVDHLGKRHGSWQVFRIDVPVKEDVKYVVASEENGWKFKPTALTPPTPSR